MTASVTTSSGLSNGGTLLNRPDNKKACSSSPTATTDDKSVIANNPFLNDYFDCIENLPSKLQILLSELRNVDSQVNARYRKLQLLKQAIFLRISPTESTQPDTKDSQLTTFESFTIEQLLHTLHQLLVQCQIYGDQKMKLTSQIMHILSSKTRQLGFDSLQQDYQQLDEEKIIKDFSVSIKKRSMHHHYNCSSSGVRNSSNRNTFSSNQLKNKSLSLDLNKYPKRVDQLDDVNSNNESNHYHTNSINNSLRNLNVINKTKQQIRHKTITNFQTNKNKLVLNNNNNKKMRLDLNSSNSNSPYLGSQLNSLKQDLTTDDSVQNRPKRQLTDNNKTLTDITLNKKRRLNQLKQTLNISTDSNHCKSPVSTTSSYSSNNSKISKRLSLKQDKLKKKYITNKIRPLNIDDKKKKETKRRRVDNMDLDSEEYENMNSNDKNKLDLPSYDDNHLKNNDPDVDRLSNETESINHIDNEDQDDLDDLSDNQLDEDDNESINFDAESNIGDDEQEDDENRDDFQYDEDEDSDYKTIKKKPYPSSNEDDLNENSENQSWVFNQQSKSKTNRSKTLNNGTTNSTTTSNTNTNATNEEELTYCICEQISYGQMICCDNKSCKIEWFHFNCVKLTTKPKGKWYCPNCRGETHKVMKKMNNKHLTSSSVYHNNNSNSGYLSSSYRAK